MISLPNAGHFSRPVGQKASRPQTAWVVLAAGMGTRMRSALPKVLHPLCGRPLGAFPLASAAGCPDWQLVVVVGHEADRVERQLREWAGRFGVSPAFARQQPQLGTGHAVASALGALAGSVREVLVSYGDVPLLRAQTLQALQQARRQAGAAAAVLTAVLEDPTGYGRVLRQDGHEVAAIVEERDATPEQKALHEVNTGIYCFDRGPLEQALAHLRPDNAQGEYYLTDAVGWLAGQGHRVVALEAADATEVLGVNDRGQLRRLEQLLRERARARLLAEGVSFPGQPPAEVDPWVQVGADSVLCAGAYVGGESRLGRGCLVGPGAWVMDSVLEEGAWVEGVTLVGCQVGAGARVGRGVPVLSGSRIAAGAVIGEPVEAGRMLRGGQAT